MGNIDVMFEYATKKNDLGFFIAAYELMIEDPDYKGVREGVQNQLEFLKYMNRNGCRTYQDVFNRISDRAVDPEVVGNFVKGYTGKDDVFLSYVKGGYPELFN